MVAKGVALSQFPTCGKLFLQHLINVSLFKSAQVPWTYFYPSNFLFLRVFVMTDLITDVLMYLQAKEDELERLEAILKNPSSLHSLKTNHPDILEHLYGEHIASSTQRSVPGTLFKDV